MTGYQAFVYHDEPDNAATDSMNLGIFPTRKVATLAAKLAAR